LNFDFKELNTNSRHFSIIIKYVLQARPRKKVTQLELDLASTIEKEDKLKTSELVIQIKKWFDK
jgi:hypothetical protein